jgi:hypothetical protein
MKMKNIKFTKHSALVFGGLLTVSGMGAAVAGDMTVQGNIHATTFSGNGAQLTNIAAAVYKNTLIVSNEGNLGGVDLTIAMAIAQANASQATPYLLKLEPGVYDIGTNSLTMLEWVDIEGSGEGITTIESSFCSISGGAINGANNSELRFLTVKNTGADSRCAALYNNGTSPSLRHVVLSAESVAVGVSGNSYRYALRNLNSASPTLDHVKIRAGGASHNRGIYNSSSSSPSIKNSEIRVGGGMDARGIFNSSSSPSITGSIIHAASATDTYGVYNISSSPTIRRTTITASHTNTSAAVSLVGMHNSSSSNITLDHSEVAATTGQYATGIYNSNSHLEIFSSQIAGKNAPYSMIGVDNVGSASLNARSSYFEGDTYSITADTNTTIAIAASDARTRRQTDVGSWKCVQSYNSSMGLQWTTLSYACEDSIYP